MVPELLVTDTEPELSPSEKSAPELVPLFVQYRVPFPKLVVVTVKVTEDPSFTLEVEGATE
jgi:hypothetical protein